MAQETKAAVINLLLQHTIKMPQKVINNLSILESIASTFWLTYGLQRPNFYMYHVSSWLSKSWSHLLLPWFPEPLCRLLEDHAVCCMSLQWLKWPQSSTVNSLSREWHDVIIHGLRTMVGIKWHQSVRNNDTRRITKRPNLTATIQSRRLSIFRHIARMDDDTDAKMILMAPPTWKDH